MTDPAPGSLVSVEWALISKEPGSERDYGIIAGSGGSPATGDLRRIAFSQIAGTPPGSLRDSEGQSAQPLWATFATFPAQRPTGGPVVSVAVQYPWDQEADSAGRPVWPKYVFACSYGSIAGTSYQALYHAAVDHVPFLESGQAALLPLEPEPLARDGLISLAEESFDWFAGVAANLLDCKSTVVVTGMQGLSVDQRLQYLDAIAALLPYGFRADLTASTEIGTGFSRTFKLIFTDRRIDNVLTIDRLGAPPAPVTEHAQKYLQGLRRKREVLGQGSHGGARRVLGQLWAQKSPTTFSAPEPALTAFEKFENTAELSWQAISDPVTPQLALKVFGAKPEATSAIWLELSDARRGQFVELLLASSVPQAADMLARNWPVVGKLALQLAELRLDGGQADTAQRILAVIRTLRADDADAVLQELLVPTSPPAVKVDSPPITARVSLLRGLERVPGPGEYPVTCAGLRFLPAGSWQPTLVHALLRDELRYDLGRAEEWVNWLCESPSPTAWGGPDPTWHRPDWAAALAYAARRPVEPPWKDSLLTIASQVQSWAITILWLAKLTGQLAEVIRQLDWTIVGLAGQAAPVEARQRALLEVLTGRLLGVTAGDGAMVDCALLILGGQAANFLAGDPSGSRRLDTDPYFAVYLAGLNRVLNSGELSAYQPHLEACYLGLSLPVKRIAGFRGGAEQLALDLEPGGIQLVIAWSEDQVRAPRLARYIVENRLVNMVLGARELEPILRPLSKYPGLDSFGATGQLRVVARRVVEVPMNEHAVEVELADAICYAYCAGIEPDAILATLGAVWGSDQRAPAVAVVERKFYDVLTRCQSLLYEHDREVEGDKRKVDDIRRYARIIVREINGLIIHEKKLGPEFAQIYAPVAERKAKLRSEVNAAIAREASLSRWAAFRWRSWRKRSGHASVAGTGPQPGLNSASTVSPLQESYPATGPGNGSKPGQRPALAPPSGAPNAAGTMITRSDAVPTHRRQKGGQGRSGWRRLVSKVDLPRAEDTGQDTGGR
jgi:hypothetical protein